MYRIFCESYNNFLKTIDGDCYRKKMSEPIGLLTNIDRYNKEKKENTTLYKKSSCLLYFMYQNIKKYPRFKAFLWTLQARNIDGKNYNISKKEDLEEQLKLINSFLKLSYWY